MALRLIEILILIDNGLPVSVPDRLTPHFGATGFKKWEDREILAAIPKGANDETTGKNGKFPLPDGLHYRPCNEKSILTRFGLC